MAYSGGASGNNAAFRVNEKSDEIAENEYFIHQASAYANENENSMGSGLGIKLNNI